MKTTNGRTRSNQIRFAGIARVNFQQVQQLGENIGTDAAQLAVLEGKELRLLSDPQEDVAADLVKICAVLVERDALVVCGKIDGEDERLETFADSEWWQRECSEDLGNWNQSVDAFRL